MHEHLAGGTHLIVGWRLVVCLLHVLFVFLVYYKIDQSNYLDGSRTQDYEGRICTLSISELVTVIISGVLFRGELDVSY